MPADVFNTPEDPLTAIQHALTRDRALTFDATRLQVIRDYQLRHPNDRTNEKDRA